MPGKQYRAHAIAAGLAALMAACGGSGTPAGPTASGPSSNSSGAGVVPGSAVFSQSPIDVGAISTITPIGNLNPPDHTLPTNHAYFFHPSAANAEVRAPAGGTLSTVRRGSGGSDDQLYVTVSAGFDYYLDHIRLDSNIVQGDRIAAGQRVGVTASAAGAMDLGVVNNAITLFFARPDRYIPGTLHADSPFKYFAEPVRSQLYARIAAADKDGRISFDQTGTLAGNWFTTDLAASVTENFGNGPKHLAFVRDVIDPSLVRISIGGSLSVSGAFYVPRDAIDPAGVSTAGGKIVYQLLFDPRATLPAGVLIVQMLADDRIRVETFSGNAPLTSDFDTAALIYIR